MATKYEETLIAGYRRRFDRFNAVDVEKEHTTKELIDRLEKTHLEGEQASLDLESERSERRRLQQQVQELREELKAVTNCRSFALVLIDADADDYIFKKKFLKNGLAGGKDAADEMLTKVKDYLKTLDIDSDRMDIMVRAYANFKGLAKVCVDKGIVTKDLDLSLFAHGFTERQALFDFVDVGAGKEGADNKIRKALGFYIGNSQCKHVILGCCHDSGYAPSLGEYAADGSTRTRITLLKGDNMHPRISALGFTQILQLNTVFASQGGRVALHARNAARSVSSPPPLHWNPSINTDRLGPILRDEKGYRLDKPLLGVVPNSPLVTLLRNGNLCHSYYLRGKCTGCSRVHTLPALDRESYDALWFIARQGHCHKYRRGKQCSDEKCIYGHQRN